MTQPDARPAGPELDAEVARVVFGRDVIQSPYTGIWGYRMAGYDDLIETESIPRYSTDIAAAWLVVEKMRELGIAELYVCFDKAGYWEVELLPGADAVWGKGVGGAVAQAETAPLAICRAALGCFP